MKRVKIIYRDGVAEQLIFENTQAAREYARQQTAARGTSGWVVSSIDCDVPAAYAYQEVSAI